jgi:acyl-CoA synthetase (AMP-forming)/AMP-acid ligase II/acyl carrier protein
MGGCLSAQTPRPSVQSLVELLRHRAATHPDQVAYTFLADGERHELHRTWAELDRRARAVAGWLETNASRGDRALMMFEEGLEYLDAFFGCMYADVLAVPVHPPDPARLPRTLPRLLTVARDAGVRVVLSTRELESALRPGLSELPAQQWLAVDGVDVAAADRWVDPGVKIDDIAYLQYTSGSTAVPKGVMVSHRNLLHQLADFDQGYDHDADTVIVTWLPATHDLGLVYGRLMSLFLGCRCVFLSPAAFMQRPSRWMAAMSHFRGTHSPSPNFGFEIAARKAENLGSLDLSCVKVLLNGAEPIRQESEERFTEVHRVAGLRPSAVTHAMGMSESTAKIVTEPIHRHPPRFVHIDGAAYERHEVVLVPRGSPNSRSVASNGTTQGDTRVVIVDPDNLEKLPADRVGEMWVGGTTVAQGYWNNPDATEATFRARTSDGDGPFLRTGDLAFVHDGEVYLSGRLKDLIIIRGQNHHPQDLEWTVASAHPALRPNCAAAFGVADGGGAGEQLVLVTEVYEDQVRDPEPVFRAIKAALWEHGIAANTIVLLPARGLPKTSSGKIQRTQARTLFQQGTIPTLFRWDAAAVGPAPTPAAGGSDLRAAILAATGRRRQQLLAEHVQSVASSLLGLAASEVEVDRPFGELGLDSVTAVEMVERVGKALGVELAGTVLFDHPTIDALSRWVVETKLGEGPAVEAVGARPDSGLDAAGISQMSDAEAEEALRRELEDL